MNKKVKKTKKWKVAFAPGFLKDVERLFSNKLRFLIPRKINDWKSEIIWAWQRVFRGYDDRITWGLNDWLNENLPKILRKMKSFVHGYPSTPFKKKIKNDIDSIKEWKNILEQMAKGFESAEKISDKEYMKKIKLKKARKDMFGQDSYIDYKFDKKYYNKLYKEFEKGIDLFKRWYFNLWD